MDIKKDPYYKQLEEIQKYGVRSVGYFDNIVKDESFNLTDLFKIINDKIIPYGVKNFTTSELRDIILTEYIFNGDEEITEGTLEQFKPLAKYFLNYNKYIKEGLKNMYLLTPERTTALHDFLRKKEFKNDDEFIKVHNTFLDKVVYDIKKNIHLRMLLDNIDSRDKKISEYRIELEEIRRQVLEEIKQDNK